MADKAISELTAAEQVKSTDLFVLQQDGTAKRLQGQVLLNWLTAAADGHGGIASITKTGTSGLADTYRITLADTTTFDFVVTNGNGLTAFTKTSTVGLVDTYRFTRSDGTYFTFAVTNGAKGDTGDASHVWIKYASQQPTAASHSMGDEPDDWMGVYSGTAATAPTDWQAYTWYQIKGDKGDTGAAATVTSTVVEYMVSDSGTIAPSGSWSTTIPTVPQGKYLWTRVTTSFNSGSPAVSYSVTRMGIDGTGSVSSVNDQSPDGTGNVTLGAANIQTNDNQSVQAVLDDLTAQGRPCPPNLLHNWYFPRPVNQRNVSGTISTTGAYFLDRWKLTSGTVTINSDGITLNGTMVQILESAVGAPVVATVLTEAGISEVVPTYSDTTKTFTITAQNKKLLGAKLELGSTQTLAHQNGGAWQFNELPDPALELAKCQRFCFAPFVGGSIFSRTTFVGANIVQFFIPTPASLRTNPVLESGTVNVGAWGSTGLVKGFTYTYTAMQNALRILANKPSHGQTDMWMDLNKVIFSADL